MLGWTLLFKSSSRTLRVMILEPVFVDMCIYSLILINRFELIGVQVNELRLNG